LGQSVVLFMVIVAALLAAAVGVFAEDYDCSDFLT
jgi:hypothetical membrane protein